MSNTQLRPLDREGLKSDSLTMKLLYAGTESTGDSELGPGQAYLVIQEGAIGIVANADKALAVSQEFGVSITGPLSLAAMPDQISLGGGYWRINPLVLTGLPSTSATPIPWLIPSQPKLASGLSEMKDAVSFLEQFSDIGG